SYKTIHTVYMLALARFGFNQRRGGQLTLWKILSGINKQPYSVSNLGFSKPLNLNECFLQNKSSQNQRKVSVNKICEMMGITKPAFYKYLRENASSC
ncbi:MAG TPA: hypothetical protein VKA92_01450, partial [Segetibacter sp.]|nr:hypothetical protein [Segetibacter sp.]